MDASSRKRDNVVRQESVPGGYHLSASGIYRIKNVVSGRVYIGSAVNLPSRWKLHRSLLRRGKHHSRSLQRSWCKHGATAFVFELIEPVDDRKRLIEREQFWINSL